MSCEGQVWRLYHSDQLLGEFTVTDADFPWLNATFRATEAFLPWRSVFDDALHLINDLDDHYQQWEDAYRRIQDALTLRHPSGRAVAEFLLHIEGDTAWWRWSDEPFPSNENDAA
ncbi:MAG: hypothetical protein DLM55_03160 [Acidimicrobiales bacterium]|nr:MAG: hypothetical protein DLM55_03160 [Acidimicrobiales bacterium]